MLDSTEISCLFVSLVLSYIFNPIYPPPLHVTWTTHRIISSSLKNVTVFPLFYMFLIIFIFLFFVLSFAGFETICWLSSSRFFFLFFSTLYLYSLTHMFYFFVYFYFLCISCNLLPLFISCLKLYAGRQSFSCSFVFLSFSFDFLLFRLLHLSLNLYFIYICFVISYFWHYICPNHGSSYTVGDTWNNSLYLPEISLKKAVGSLRAKQLELITTLMT